MLSTDDFLESLMLIKSEENVLGTIADIRAVISTRFEEIETGYRIPTDIIDAMKSAGVFRMFIPQRFGGLELTLPIIIESLRELSRVDASVGWTAMIGAGSALFATMLPLAAFERIYKEDPDAIIAGSTQLLGTIEKRGDTWHANGQWPFASGCLQASWMLGFCTLGADDKNGSGPPQIRVVILPASRWSIIDTWRVPGLKGTGSHDIALDCPVSPETDFFDLSAPERWISGPLYSGVPQMIALMHGAVSLGIAEGALDDLLAIAASGRQQERAGAPMRDTEAFQRDIGQVHADIRAARAALKEQTESHWRHAQNGTLGTDARLIEGSQTAIWVVGTCLQAVDKCFALGGSAAIYDSSPLQRRMRDIHIAAQHNLMQPRHYQKAGKLLVSNHAL